ncbi:hypothetical protein CDCA_CDCA06G1833 [Cyanidium caldarium]|uniref:Proline iminopeptidase n=1 Tax=Cyanidium caldarium TaxID=2771 RepID=A0AAV9IUP2_CYACA|nr:hypothetical protein CDCA_CDCA06G1833 [Cyanidium caldarium]|eukprot:ctg_122.g64
MNTADYSSAAQSALYPPIQPYDTGMLTVSERHRIYYEQCGNPNGQPALSLHGGPGGGSDPKHRRFFDPQHYRIILFDQRGCGRSVPAAELRENTTWHLVEDIGRLRQHLGVTQQMLVFGGSWGSTLALALAETHPEWVSALVLRGVFTLRRRELEWFYEGGGADHIYADAWERFLEVIPPAERHKRQGNAPGVSDLMGAYYRRLTSDDPAVRLAAARAWSTWEAATSHLRSDPDAIAKYSKDRFAEGFARIECHYFVHGGFFERDGWLLEEAQCARIRHLPCVIVQGRYDIVCPFETAWLLKKRLPDAEFFLVEDAGHSAHEPGIEKQLLAATDRLRGL